MKDSLIAIYILTLMIGVPTAAFFAYYNFDTATSGFTLDPSDIRGIRDFCESKGQVWGQIDVSYDPIIGLKAVVSCYQLELERGDAV